jgi:hypothetical protein
VVVHVVLLSFVFDAAAASQSRSSQPPSERLVDVA